MVDINLSYYELISIISPELINLNFKLRGRQEFIRKSIGPLQRLAFSLRKPPGETVGYVESFPGFNFAEVESLAASLQGKKPRPGFITCSLNIGLLAPGGTNLEWPLSTEGNIADLAQIILKAIVQFAEPFWEEFSSINNLIVHLEKGDFRIRRGTEWPWRLAAAYCLVGRPTQAIEFLQRQFALISDSERVIIKMAIQKIERFKME